MFTKIESWLSLGNQYVAATVVYLGFALLLGGTTLLDAPKALATNDKECSHTVPELQEEAWVDVTYDGCPEGEQCCGGECISEDMICCEDGTYGNADTCECLCCESCGGDSLTTVVCDDDE